MDVRCDRCQTEYELDDESVAAGGASVQCTSCGNTFVVGRDRRPATAPPVPSTSMSPSGGPTTSSWMLTTEEGKTHRFRDSTTLQKWVVERRVGKADRVCPPGGAWRRLGDVDELRPFFDVVDQADRAAVAARGSRPTRPETPRASAQGRQGYVSPDADDDDILTSDRRPRQSAVSASFASLSPEDDLIAAGLGTRHGGRKLAVVAIVGLMALALYLGFKGPSGFRLPWGAPDRNAVAVPVLAPPTAAAPASPRPPVPVPAPAAAPPPAAAPSPAPTPAEPPSAAPVAAAAPAPAAHPTAAPPDEPTAPAPPEPATPRGGAATAEPGRPKSYEHLVSDADHALENGQTAKAQKLYDEALKLQPNGVAAVAGAAYLLLDRQKPLAAIDMFQRALTNAPSFAPALFGLGEAHRLAGQPAKAAEAYKKYLEASPTGSDAPAARRQMRELESQAAAAPPRQEAPATASPTFPAPQM